MRSRAASKAKGSRCPDFASAQSLPLHPFSMSLPAALRHAAACSEGRERGRHDGELLWLREGVGRHPVAAARRRHCRRLSPPAGTTRRRMPCPAPCRAAPHSSLCGSPAGEAGPHHVSRASHRVDGRRPSRTTIAQKRFATWARPALQDSMTALQTTRSVWPKPLEIETRPTFAPLAPCERP